MLGREDVLFIDARTPEEYAAGRIPGAVNIPYEAVFGDMSAVAKDLPKGATLIIYCSDIACGKSRELAESLKMAGFEKTAVMPEGLKGWVETGGKTESGEDA